MVKFNVARSGFYGISEIFSVILMLILVAVLFGIVLIYVGAQTGAIGSVMPSGSCKMRIVDVYWSGSTATIFVYNYGDIDCKIVRGYGLDQNGNVIDVLLDVSAGVNLCPLACSDAARYADVTCVRPQELTQITVNVAQGVEGFRIVDACGVYVDWP